MSRGPDSLIRGPNEAYALAASAGGLVFLAGHVGSAPDGGPDAPFALQVRRAFTRLFATLHEAGLTPSALLKVNVFLSDAADFDAFNAIYLEILKPPRPPRTTIEAQIAHGWKFEVDAVAWAGSISPPMDEAGLE